MTAAVTAMVFTLAACTGAPKINSITPGTAKPGDTITISGEGFAPNKAGFSVAIGGVSAPVTSATEKEIVVKVPDGATSGKVTVYSNNQHVDGTFQFGETPPAQAPPTGGPTAAGSAAALENLAANVPGLKIDDKQSGSLDLTGLFPSSGETAKMHDITDSAGFLAAYHGVFSDPKVSYADITLVQVSDAGSAQSIATSWNGYLKKATAGSVKATPFSGTFSDGIKYEGFKLVIPQLDDNAWIFAAKGGVVFEMRVVGNAKWADGSKVEQLLDPVVAAAPQ